MRLGSEVRPSVAVEPVSWYGTSSGVAVVKSPANAACARWRLKLNVVSTLMAEATTRHRHIG